MMYAVAFEISGAARNEARPASSGMRIRGQLLSLDVPDLTKVPKVR